MPDCAAHYYFGQDVLMALPTEVRSLIDQNTFDFALSGPDDWALYQICMPTVHNSKRDRAHEMHTSKTGEFLSALAKEPLLFSYTAGFICHYAFDSVLHPYIIACAGTYDKTPATEKYRGNHMAFEHSIDNLFLCQHNNKRLHPISRHMQGMPLPRSLKFAIDRVYHEVYGWDHAFRDLLRAKRGLKLYLWITEDPYKILKFLTGFFRHPTLRALPYSRKCYVNADISNVQHRTWHHPNDPTLFSTESLEELFEKAAKKAASMILSVFNGDNSAIGNYSYMTGFDLSDPRNKENESYCILPRYD